MLVVQSLTVIHDSITRDVLDVLLPWILSAVSTGLHPALRQHMEIFLCRVMIKYPDLIQSCLCQFPLFSCYHFFMYGLNPSRIHRELKQVNMKPIRASSLVVVLCMYLLAADTEQLLHFLKEVCILICL